MTLIQRFCPVRPVSTEVELLVSANIRRTSPRMGVRSSHFRLLPDLRRAALSERMESAQSGVECLYKQLNLLPKRKLSRYRVRRGMDHL